MRRTVWNEELMAEVTKRLRFGFTMNEIAETLELSLYGLRTAVRKYNMVSKEELARLKGERVAVNNRTEKMRRATSQNLKRRWKDPEYREKILTGLYECSEEARSTFGQRMRERLAQARGFEIPDDRRAEYNRLCDIYKIPAREAGRILGLLPPKANDNAASDRLRSRARA